MTPEEIETLINSKIRSHEIRVAFVSGIVGGTILAGIFHAIQLSYSVAIG